MVLADGDHRENVGGVISGDDFGSIKLNLTMFAARGIQEARGRCKYSH